MYILKQLLPLSYYSNFEENGANIIMTWKMWFGKCFKIRKYEIKREL